MNTFVFKSARSQFIISQFQIQSLSCVYRPALLHLSILALVSHSADQLWPRPSGKLIHHGQAVTFGACHAL